MPVPGMTENLRKIRVARLPPEQAACPVRGRSKNGRIAWAAVGEDHGDFVAGYYVRGFYDLEHGTAVAGAKVQGRGGRVPRAG